MLPTSVQYRLAAERADNAQTRSVVDLSKFDEEIDYFRRNIGNVNSNADLLADPRLFNFAMAAFDLPVDANARGFMRTLLSENPNDRGARVNQLENAGYEDFVRVFRFSETTNAPIRSQDVVDTVVDRFRNTKVAEARLNAVGTGDNPVGFRAAQTPVERGEVFLDLAEADREIAYFQATAPQIETTEELLQNRRVINFALEANGLPSENLRDDFIETIFTEDPDAPESLVNQPGNERYGDVVRSFVFGDAGGDEQAQAAIDAQRDVAFGRLSEQYAFNARLEARFAPTRSIATPSSFTPVSLQAAPPLAEAEGAPAVSADRQAEIDYFLANIGSVQSADDLLNDRRLFEFAMTAFDLQSQIDSKGLIERLMTEDREDEDAVINRLQNPQYREFGAMFDFSRVTRKERSTDAVTGALSVTRTEDVGDGFANVRDQRELLNVVDRYISVSREIDEGEQNPDVRLALYFDRNAGEVESYFGLLADPALREFVFSAYALPQELNQLPVERLADRFEQLFSLDDVQSEEGRQGMIDRFLAVRNAATQTSPNAAALALFPGASGGGLFSLASTLSAGRTSRVV
ncbi:MAG: DUF1217 domain-containing protein [Pseudomonadota bacterium]